MKEQDEDSTRVPEKELRSLYKDASEYTLKSVAEADLTQFHRIGQLTEQSRKIQSLFNKLVESTIRYLMDTDTSPKEVIERMDAYMPEECCEASDLDDLFFKLVPHMSFFNPDLLKIIIEQMGDKDLQRKMSEYEKQFVLYCRNRISGPHPVIFTNEALNKEPLAQKLLVKLDTEWEGLPLAEVKRFHCIIATILNVRQESVLLQSIQKGCVLFTFLIQKSVALRIRESGLSPHQKTTLHETRAMSIVLGTKTLHHSNVLQLHKPVATPDPEYSSSHANRVHVQCHEQLLVLLWIIYILTVKAIAKDFHNSLGISHIQCMIV